MCLVSKHREIENLLAEKDLTITQQQARIAELLNHIADMELPPVPEVTYINIGKSVVKREIEAEGIELLRGLMDAKYRYVSSSDWMNVFEYIYLVFPWPKYTAQYMDCDDFAFLVKGMVNAFFGINYFAFTLGDIPQGYHGFNIFRDEKGLMCLEPQNMKFFEWGDRDYLPQKVLL